MLLRWCMKARKIMIAGIAKDEQLISSQLI
jgi:hypothetical protein